MKYILNKEKLIQKFSGRVRVFIDLRCLFFVTEFVRRDGHIYICVVYCIQCLYFIHITKSVISSESSLKLMTLSIRAMSIEE